MFSGLAPTADVSEQCRHFRVVPRPDFMHRSNPLRLFDHLVDAGEQYRVEISRPSAVTHARARVVELAAPANVVLCCQVPKWMYLDRCHSRGEPRSDCLCICYSTCKSGPILTRRPRPA